MPENPNARLLDTGSMDTEYRLFNTAEDNTHTPSDGPFDAQWMNHDLLLEPACRLGAVLASLAVPVARLVVEPLLPDGFLVFFGWNTANPTLAAGAVLGKAVAAARARS